MALRIQLGERGERSVPRKEDLWFLVLEDEGTHHVEHAWSHDDGDGTGARSGTNIFSVEEFLASDSDERLKTILRAALRTVARAAVRVLSAACPNCNRTMSLVGRASGSNASAELLTLECDCGQTQTATASQ